MECKNRRIGAAAIINALKHPKKKNEKQSEKKKALNEGREGSNPLIWSPTDAVNSTLLEHPSTYSPTQKKKGKKTRKKAQNREERARMRSSGVPLM